jgi:ribosomal protein S13
LACQKIENKRTRELSEEELTVLRDEVSKYQVEGDLVRLTFAWWRLQRLTRFCSRSAASTSLPSSG